MSIDGFQFDQTAAFAGYSHVAATRFYQRIGQIMKPLRIEVDGVEQLPTTRALIVGNHTFGWDAMFPMGAVFSATGRPVWALGEHLWWKIPVLRRLASAIGTVDGTPTNIDRLLEEEQLVLVLPGGLREAVKPRELRYRLLWGHRYGFVRAAIRNRAPIVPLAAIGADDFFDFVGDPFARGRRWLRGGKFPIPLPSRILPIPRLARLRFVFGEPIPMPDDVDLEHDEVTVRRLRREVEGALHELIETELARRAGIDCG